MIRQWQLMGLGYQLDDNYLLSHLIWADNIFVCCSTESGLKQMIEMMTEALHAAKLWWKPASLMTMATLDMRETIWIPQLGNVLECVQVGKCQCWDALSIAKDVQRLLADIDWAKLRRHFGKIGRASRPIFFSQKPEWKTMRRL